MAERRLKAESAAASGRREDDAKAQSPANQIEPVRDSQARRGEAAARLRLDFLDGMRGMAALAVAAGHFAFGAWPLDAPFDPPALRWLGFGGYAVDVFIVISGCCLMLPIARTGELQGGVAAYLRRRSRRILPPYYASLALSLSVLGLLYLAGWQSLAREYGVLTPGALVAHLLLVHNLSPAWVVKINPPLWTIATEWQIYFLFPLALLPVWRRFGIWAAIAAGFALGLAPHYAVPGGKALDSGSPWFLGLFAMGMGAALAGVRGGAGARVWAWGAAAAMGAVLVVICGPVAPMLGWKTDALVGLAAACLIATCMRDDPGRNWIRRMLESRAVAALGRFSYSLYLIHFPLMWLFVGIVRAMGVSRPVEAAARLAVGLPMAVAAAYAFYLAFERPFLTRRPESHAAP